VRQLGGGGVFNKVPYMVQLSLYAQTLSL